MKQDNNGRVKVRLRNFSRSLPISLLSAREAVVGRFRQVLRSHNVTEQQWRVLRTLNAVGGLEVLELAEATSLLAPSLSRILNDLERRGLATRQTVPQDLRKSRIFITAAGSEIVESMEPSSEAIYGEILSAFGKERMDQLLKLLSDLSQTVAKLPPVNQSLDDLDSDVFRIADITMTEMGLHSQSMPILVRRDSDTPPAA